MHVIITEKPSVAKDFATYFNAQMKDGYYYSSDGKELKDEVAITWAYGHLLKNTNIEDLPKKWALENLPIFPEKFNYKPNNSAANKQIKVISSLINKPGVTVINAGDPAREGELIQRLILNYIKYDYRSFKRFWSSEALTPNVIQIGLSKMKEGAEFDTLYQSAIARQHADWIIGINLTQATSLHGNQTYSIGRVQTPILNLIVGRHLEIKNFKKQVYYSFNLNTSQGEITNIPLTFNGEELTKDVAEEKLSKILNSSKAEILSIETKTIVKKAPKPHSLTSLQQEANKEYGMTAAKTLDVAQSLYETKKAISYPRTDSNYLGENTKEQIQSIANKLELIQEKKIEELTEIFDNTKLTDHHAIIPLRKLAEDEEMSVDEKKIYYLIKRRFEGIFLKDEEVEDISITAISNEEKLKGGVKNVLIEGWTKLYKTQSKNVEDNSRYKLLKEGEVDVIGGEIKEIEKKPPKNFNDSSILSRMKSLELGTPATRADILEKLIVRSYIERKKNTLIPTEKGIELISNIKDRNFASPEMTSIWEANLSKIEDGKITYEEFIKNVKDFTIEELENLKTIKFENNFLPPKMVALAKKLVAERKLNTKIEEFKSFEELKSFIDNTINEALDKCICGSDIVSSLKAYSCNNKECGRIVWKEAFGTKIKAEEAISLIRGEEVLFKNLKSKAGKKYEAVLVIDSNNKLTFKK